MLGLPVSKYVISFVVATATSALVVPLIIYLCRKFKILSKIDFRRKNDIRTPLLGGLSIFIAFIVAALSIDASFAGKLLLCGLPIVITGIIDDIWELPSQPKFIAQIIAVTLWLGFTPDDGLMLEKLGMARTLAFILTGFWMVGIINAFNFIDGMDGEASLTSTMILITLVLLTKNTESSYAAMALAGACFGFALYNLPPAKIYLGDSGSTFLGFATSALAAHLVPPMASKAYVLIPLFLFAFPEIDACLAIFRRLRSGTSIFKGDHEHLHHKLQKLGFSVSRSLIVIGVAIIYSCFTAWFISELSETHLILSATVISTMGLLGVLGAVYYTYFRLAKQVSVYSRTLMHKYIEFTNKLYFDPRNFFGVSFDLLPYYKEIQQRGLLSVDNFVNSFAVFLTALFPDGNFKLVGSYTIVALAKKGLGQKKNEAAIALAFHDLLSNYKLIKTGDKTPSGLNFYSDSKDAEAFHKLATIEASGAVEITQLPRAS
ncbi:MAG: MraY family glycosyltransferase [Pseudomonadota bacterium]|nr:MraY family glycosyltransferase [Pseudomonadota bacterium]